MKRQIRFLTGSIVLGVVLVAALYTQRVYMGDLWREANAPVLPEPVTYEEVQEDGTEGTNEETVGTQGTEDQIAEPNPPVPSDSSVPSVPPSIPAEFNLAVPFTSQAPFANWDAVHEETCEEASVYMVHAFYEGVTGRIDPQTAEDELQRLVAKQVEMFGFFEDTTAAQTAEFAKAMYGYERVEIVTNPTVEDLKALIADGYPIIMPAAGQRLGNPNFTGAGPPYHMLVIRGYSDGHFITNDPGTRRGEAYVYPEETIMNAMHDWTGSDATIETGANVVLVIYP